MLRTKNLVKLYRSHVKSSSLILPQVRQKSQNAVDYEKPFAKCDAVVIGGGSLGCNTLYHLAKQGMTNVILLENNKLTSGTTWHTAGLIWSLRPSDTDIQLLKITRELIGRLEEETGINPGYINNGGLFLASHKERLNEYKRLHTIGKPFGIESQMLSPNETKDLCPVLNTTGLTGALYCKGDGSIDPTGFCSALTRYATRQGAKVVENCQVVGFNTVESEYHNFRVMKGLHTSMGYIETPLVFNCTGVWAPQLCEMLNVNIPIVPMKHAYVIFEKMDEVKGLPNIRDHDAGIYFLIKGDVLSLGGYEANPHILDKVDQDFAFGLYELDWDVFGTHIDGAIEKMPNLENVGIRSTVCGPESFTPDHKPIMGEDPSVKGFFHGAGFNSAGMMFGGGCGHQLVQWALKGQPDLDMFSYDIRRFSPKQCANKQWAKERSHEAYATNYKIVYKNDEYLAGRNISKGPLHDILEQQGCVYQERQSWERPGFFDSSKTYAVHPYDWMGQYGYQSNGGKYKQAVHDEYTFEFSKSHKMIHDECQACRNQSVIFDMSYFGKFFLVGEDAASAAEFIFTNHMTKPPNSVIYTCMLNENGGILADLTATVLHDSLKSVQGDPRFQGTAYYLAIGGTSAYYTFANIQSKLRNHKFKAQLLDCSEEYGLMSIQGPKSRDILSEIFNGGTSFDNESFPFSTHKIIEYKGHKVRALRLSFVGELGWELHVPKNICESLYKDIMKVGEKHGIRNAGYRAIDSLSAEKGYRHWHGDIRADDNPLEAGLGFTCKLKDESKNFIGRKALEEAKNNLSKKLFCFTMEGDKPLWGLESIWDDEQNKPVGYLRRAEYAFSLNKTIGYGYISQDLTNVSIKKFKELKQRPYSIESFGERKPAEILLKSPFDPDNRRVQGVYN